MIFALIYSIYSLWLQTNQAIRALSEIAKLQKFESRRNKPRFVFCTARLMGAITPDGFDD